MSSNKNTSKEPTQSRQLLDLFHKNFSLCRDADNNEFFAIPKSGPNIAVPFSNIPGKLSSLFIVRSGKTPANNAVQEAKRQLESECSRADEVALPLRVSWADEKQTKIIVDMGNSKGEVIEVTARGWEVLERSPYPFRRTAATQAMFDPRLAEAGSIDGLREIFNVNDSAWNFLVAWLATVWVPDMPHICLVLRGRQGSAKTTLAQYLVNLVDPSRAAQGGCTEMAADLIAHARGSLVIGLDNVWSFSPAASDTLSRLITGDAIRKRKLYTDADVHITTMRRIVVMNGIEITGIKQDLRDRCVNVNLMPISSNGRKREQHCEYVFRQEGPAAVRFLLDTLSGALKASRNPRYLLQESRRMADAEQWLKYVDVVRGTSTAGAYHENSLSDDRESALDDVLARHLVVLLKTSPEVANGGPMPARDWLTALGPRPEGVPSGAWPYSPRALTARIRLLESGLRSAGWTVEETIKNNSTCWNIKIPG